MNVLIVSDAWTPQVNGVVRTIVNVRAELEQMGHTVEVIGPDRFRTVPMPSYPEIRLALWPARRLAQMIDAAVPDCIHIATEGPLGFAARKYCLKRGIPFTTAYHTRFPEYVRDRIPVPLALGYAVVRRFHGPSSAVMVATQTIEDALRARGFANLKRWTRGVDTNLFRPRDKSFIAGPRPVSMYVGRVAVEKNIEDFLKLDLPGVKYVVGDGPARAELEKKYPDAVWVGARHGEELARYYAAADVFVFPSRSDTFGLVLLEALACGVPVAAYPSPGPLDVIGDSGVGALNEDLAAAVRQALTVSPRLCRDHALRYSWRASAEQFIANLRPFIDR